MTSFTPTRTNPGRSSVGMGLILMAAVACAAASQPNQRSLPVFTNPPECSGVAAQAAVDTTLVRQGPVPLQVILPPIEGLPYALRGDTVMVRFVVDETGGVTAVEFRNLGYPNYEARLRARLTGYRFQPAEIDGCWVTGQHVLRIVL